MAIEAFSSRRGKSCIVWRNLDAARRAVCRRPVRIPKTTSAFVLEAGGGEGVAVLRAPGIEAALEPAHALRRGAVREGLGHHATLRLLLQAIVADRGGGVQ